MSKIHKSPTDRTMEFREFAFAGLSCNKWPPRPVLRDYRRGRSLSQKLVSTISMTDDKRAVGTLHPSRKQSKSNACEGFAENACIFKLTIEGVVSPICCIYCATGYTSDWPSETEPPYEPERTRWRKNPNHSTVRSPRHASQ